MRSAFLVLPVVARGPVLKPLSLPHATSRSWVRALAYRGPAPARRRSTAAAYQHHAARTEPERRSSEPEHKDGYELLDDEEHVDADDAEEYTDDREEGAVLRAPLQSQTTRDRLLLMVRPEAEPEPGPPLSPHSPAAIYMAQVKHDERDRTALLRLAREVTHAGRASLAPQLFVQLLDALPSQGRLLLPAAQRAGLATPAVLCAALRSAPPASLWQQKLLKRVRQLGRPLPLVVHHALMAVQPERAAEQLAELQSDGHTAQVRTFVELLHAAARVGDAVARQRWADRLRAHGPPPQALVFHSLILHTLLGGESPAPLLAEMNVAGAGPSLRTFELLLQECVVRGDRGRAREWYQQLVARGLRPSLLVLHQLLAIEVDTDVAEAWLREFRSRWQVTPRRSTHHLLMRCAGRARRPDLLWAYLQTLTANGHQLVAGTYNVALLYAPSLDACVKTLQEMEQRGLAPTTETYNAVLQALIRFNKPASVPRFVDEMQRRHVPMDSVTDNLRMRAALSVTEAMRVLNEARAAGRLPSQRTFYWLIAAGAREREAPLLRQAYDEMRALGHKPTRHLFRLLLRSCVSFLPAADLAFYQAEMERCGLRLDGPDSSSM